MKPTLEPIVTVMRQVHGMDVSCHDESFLEKSLAHRLAATSVPTISAYSKRLECDREEASAFFRSLTISYSEFFRNPLTFAMLEQVVLPGLAEAGEKAGQAEIRVWSAGCAAGQEAWSLAILLDELLAARNRRISFRVIATDGSAEELEVARRGVYDTAALQNVRTRHLREYFVRGEGESFQIIPRLRTRVDFSVYDLLDRQSATPPAGIFGDFDLIMCCNLLLYYRPEARQFMLEKLRRALSPQGYLATGEAEREIAVGGGFQAVAAPAAVFRSGGKRKNG